MIAVLKKIDKNLLEFFAISTVELYGKVPKNQIKPV